MSLGFKGVRVRSHENLARIEVDKDLRKKLCKTDLMNKIGKKLRDMGFQFVTIDVDGYRIGSFDNN